MMERRDLVTGGGLMGIVALAAGGEAGTAAQGAEPDAVAREVRAFRQALEANVARPWARIAPIREQQRTWLRTHHKYPDFIEIGVDIWDALHDWHVRHQQPVSMTRTADGRYVMPFMFTTFILRPDTNPDYIGPPFDQERRP